MRIETKQIFDENDRKLLAQPLPENPCSTCGAGAECCGCPKGNAYEKAIQPYKDANIFEIACDLQRRRHILDEISKLNAEMDEINKRVPDFCRP